MQLTINLLNSLNSVDSTRDVSNVVKDRFQQLFPNIPLMISTMIGFSIVLVILFTLLYKPTRQMMQRRHDFIQNNINESIKAKEDALNNLNQAQQNLLDSHQQSAIIINKARAKADEILADYKVKAKNEANRLLEDARLDIESKKEDFNNRSKEIIANIAIDIARQILQKEITEETQKEIIDNFLKDDTPLGKL